MLEIQKIRKTFHAGTPNEVRALQGIDLRIEDGSFVVVIGTNGSGKSTLLNAVAGSFFVDVGRLRLNGHDITRWPEHRRAKFIGRVFQDPFRGTAPGMTIAENLALASKRGRMRGLWPALRPSVKQDFHERVRRMGLGLENRLNNAIGSLSGGQRQSLTLLMARTYRLYRRELHKCPALALLFPNTASIRPLAKRWSRSPDKISTWGRTAPQ
jgi:putative ABC transport system ATP-binding protein